MDVTLTGETRPKVANATPLGMRAGDPLPVEASRLTAGQFVADVITRPAISPLLVAARAIGCATRPGAGMFNAQAALLADRILGGRMLRTESV